MSNGAEAISTEGYTALTRNGGRGMYHHQRIEIHDGEVVVTLIGLGADVTPVDPVRSDHPAVLAFARAIDDARVLSAFINRSMQSICHSCCGSDSLESKPTG
jgi:hypothetical protein